MTFLSVLFVLVTVQLCCGLPANQAVVPVKSIETLEPKEPQTIDLLENVSLPEAISDDQPIDSEINAEEVSGNFEGDMILTESQKRSLTDKKTKAGLINPFYNWPSGIVYYEIASGVFTQDRLNMIANALYTIEYYTCVRFLRRTTQTDYIRVGGANTGCWSSIGKRGGLQNMNLQPNGCFSIGTVMHEFIHALGFYHMQSATARDQYVTINWANIQPGQEHNFNTYGSNVISTFGVAYDMASVMHYGPTAFTRNGQPTISANTPNSDMGQRRALSFADVQRINNKYC